MEISFCLNEMLNVDCKIISVSSGSEICEKARELQYHFNTEGTPVMIGGSSYAHTIVGIDFNEMTGQVRYLIVDPHYTGVDDIKVIINKVIYCFINFFF
jgi:Ufm1-specific protease 2